LYIVEFKIHTTDTVAKYSCAAQLLNDSLMSR